MRLLDGYSVFKVLFPEAGLQSAREGGGKSERKPAFPYAGALARVAAERIAAPMRPAAPLPGVTIPLMTSHNDRIPVYLLWYLLRIRRHSGEIDFFAKRFADMDEPKMLIEVQMAGELYKRGLILLPSEKKGEKVFNPLTVSAAPGVSILRSGTEQRITYWKMFDLTPAGKYVIVETLFQLAGSTAKTFVIALVGAAAAILLHG